MLTWEYNADAEKRVLKQEAREEGYGEGRIEGHKDIALKLKKAGIISVKEIAELTGLYESEVEQL